MIYKIKINFIKFELGINLRDVNSGNEKVNVIYIYI